MTARFVPPSDLVAFLLRWAQTRWKEAWNLGVAGMAQAQAWERIIVELEGEWVLLHDAEAWWLSERPAPANQYEADGPKPL